MISYSYLKHVFHIIIQMLHSIIMVEKIYITISQDQSKITDGVYNNSRAMLPV